MKFIASSDLYQLPKRRGYRYYPVSGTVIEISVPFHKRNDFHLQSLPRVSQASLGRYLTGKFLKKISCLIIKQSISICFLTQLPNKLSEILEKLTGITSKWDWIDDWKARKQIFIPVFAWSSQDLRLLENFSVCWHFWLNFGICGKSSSALIPSRLGSIARRCKWHFGWKSANR
jgi:hypothetical protein